MSTFKFEAMDDKGKKVKGSTTAKDPKHLVEKLKNNGIYVTSYVIADKNDTVQKKDEVLYASCVNEPVLVNFFFQLSAMLRSGVGITIALSALKTQTKRYDYFIGQLYTDVFNGSSLTQAMMNQPKHFSAFIIFSVKSGEASGNLDKQLLTIAEKFQNNMEIKKVIKRETMYYVVIFFFLMVVSFIFPFVFASMFGIKLNAATFKLPISMLMFLFLIFVIKKFTYLPFLKRKLDYIKIKVPLIKGAMRELYTSRFAETLSQLYKSGMNVTEAFSSSVAVTDNSYITESLSDAANRLLLGDTLTNTLNSCEYFDTSLNSALAVGEKTGMLTDELDRIANNCRDDAKIKILRVSKCIKPIFFVLILILIALYALDVSALVFEAIA